jgi:hypothetical protein
LIAAESVYNVPLCTSIDDREDWIVEKIIIGTNDSNIMATLTTWVSFQYPYLPIANPSKLPRYICAGEIIEHLMNPEEFMNRPTTNESWAQHATSAKAMKSVIQGSLHAQDLASSTLGAPTTQESKLEEEENWGPKMTALLDDMLNSDITKLVNLGPDIPSVVHPELV